MTKLLSLYGRTVSLIVVLFVVSFTVLTLAFLAMSAMEERDRVRDLEKTILTANTGARDFMLTRDPQDAKDTELLLQKADLVVRKGIRATNYQQLHNEVLLYLHTINNLIEVYQRRGFYEDEGIEGQIRSRLNRLDAMLEERGQSEARISLLSARRMEKNFLLREDSRYADGVHVAIDDLMKQIMLSSLPQQEMTAIFSDLNEYQHDFDELVSLVNRAEWIHEDLLLLQRAIGNTLSHVIGLEQRRARSFLWASLGLILLAFVIGILYSMHVARTVLKPLESVRGFVKRVADGEEIDLDTWNESDDASSGLHELMISFQDVAEQVRLRKEAEHDLKVSKEALQQYADELEERTEQLDLAVDKLGMAKTKAEDDSRNKAEFLASMSHEIRTPLNGIIGMTSLLNHDEMSADQQEIIGVIRTSGESLLSVVNHVLDFSKIEAGGMSLEAEPTDIATCVEDALGMISRQAAEKGLDLSCAIDPCVPHEILGDAARIRQILINLLGNAVKFTHEGEIQVRVGCAERGRDHLVLHFSIEDTGIGIDEEQLKHLFKPFTQAEASTSRRFGGTGLGLTISQRLADLMGGSMWVESRPGRGSTFHFRINAQVSANSKQYEPLEIAGGKRLLFLTQKPLIGEAMAINVKEFGLKVDIVQSEEEATARLNESDYLAVFINESNGGIDGVAGAAIARMLRGDALDTPFVVLRHIQQQLGDETIACLLKPLRASALRDFLQRIVGVAGQHENIIPLMASGPSTVRRTIADDREAQRNAPRLKVLLVEDNAVNQKVGVRMLEKLNCSVDVVDRGEKAIEAVRLGNYSHVFMDVQMPGMDGMDATRQIRRLDRIVQPVIIALTANATTKDRHKCLESGMDDYASKPVDPKMLGLLLERHSSGDGHHGPVRRAPSLNNGPTGDVETSAD